MKKKIKHLYNLSRDCYSLFERTVNEEKLNFIYDKNVISMSKAGDNYYYLHDELSSPMYITGTDGATIFFLSLFGYDVLNNECDISL
ncbi:hypothetical protein [Butyrivibrio fibrisolvens]|uniref:Uncharacterized protein n=1 Tax=Butyrivibrio fibrisolvens TaxID=831 RepID=A0A317G1K0_BUTFI|nr:hypothetical protein [Butyrivibrio fibrisolvens]PWT27206.1 hypothetical protein CPT75_08865 [Butyrivibrio fibrisolvens]